MAATFATSGLGCEPKPAESKPAESKPAEPKPAESGATPPKSVALERDTAGPVPAPEASGTALAPTAVEPSKPVPIALPNDAFLAKYPAIAEFVRSRTKAARETFEKMQSEAEGCPEELEEDDPICDPRTWSLAIEWTVVVDAPTIVSLKEYHHEYSGGSRGMETFHRHHWWPGSDEPFSPSELFVGPNVRSKLHQGVKQALEAAGLETFGVDADSRALDQFEPVLDANHRIIALRFFFEPGDVSAVADGEQSVVVSAAVLRDIIAPEGLGKFALPE